MKKYILADNQELTSYALQSLLGRDEHNQIFRSTDKAGLLQLLKEHESAVVILDYTLFDFNDVESLIITSERFAMASWVLISEELTKDFLQKTVYASHAFSVVFKDEPMRTIRGNQHGIRWQTLCQSASYGDYLGSDNRAGDSQSAHTDRDGSGKSHSYGQDHQGDCCRKTVEHSHHQYPSQKYFP